MRKSYAVEPHGSEDQRFISYHGYLKDHTNQSDSCTTSSLARWGSDARSMLRAWTVSCLIQVHRYPPAPYKQHPEIVAWLITKDHAQPRVFHSRPHFHPSLIAQSPSWYQASASSLTAPKTLEYEASPPTDPLLHRTKRSIARSALAPVLWSSWSAICLGEYMALRPPLT